MKYKGVLSIISTMIILGLLPVGCSSDYPNEISSDDGNENTAPKSSCKDNGIVYVTDYGAKDFVDPVECQLDGTNIIIARNGTSNLSVGDTVKIINGTEADGLDRDLTAKIKAIDGSNIELDRKCGNTIITKVYIDSTKAFKTAFSYANVTNLDVIIPKGNYYVNGDIYVQTNIKCEGKIYTTNKGKTPLFIILRRGESIKISGSDITGSLEASSTHIPELEQYADYDVIFNSQERIMWRNNNPGEFYTKNEANRIKCDGTLMVELVESYSDKSLLTLYLYKRESPISLVGLNIMCIDDAITDEGKCIIAVRRSDVTIDKLILDNENLNKEEGQSSGVGILNAINVTLSDCRIRGFMFWGLGYGVTSFNTLKVTLNNTEICKTRHAVTGRHDNYTTINGGSYEGYGGTLDSHWGHNFTVNNATINGDIAFAYDGNNLMISKCRIKTDYHLLIFRRMDCPTIKGNVEIKDTTVTYAGAAHNFVFYCSKLTDFLHEAEIYNPNLILENVVLELQNDISIVDIYTVNHDLNTKYIMQKLPETISVNNLYITGTNDSKLKNTYFRMMAATNKYYTGNPEIYLENIRINRETESSNNLNYDGKIAYSFNPDHAKTEVPDTHYRMTVKDCGTLSVNIIPTILGDMVIENCIIVDYIYAGSLVNDWPYNHVWWYKGTGKSFFRNVMFDRTGLSPSSLTLMNDAEFERCEFTSFGTVDYMNFGGQLPTVQILKVKDCIIHKDGITSGTLSKNLLP